MGEIPGLVGERVISSKVSMTIAVILSFLIAPSKVAAIAYALLLGGIVIVVFIGLGLVGGLGSLILKYWRS